MDSFTVHDFYCFPHELFMSFSIHKSIHEFDINMERLIRRIFFSRERYDCSSMEGFAPKWRVIYQIRTEKRIIKGLIMIRGLKKGGETGGQYMKIICSLLLFVLVD